MWGNVIYLITLTPRTNSIGDAVTTLTKRQVYAEKKTVRQFEVYQASSVGLCPELKFTIRISDYNNERHIEYNEVMYNIIRTYEKNEEFIELICQGTTHEVI